MFVIVGLAQTEEEPGKILILVVPNDAILNAPIFCFFGFVLRVSCRFVGTLGLIDFGSSSCASVWVCTSWKLIVNVFVSTVCELD